MFDRIEIMPYDKAFTRPLSETNFSKLLQSKYNQWLSQKNDEYGYSWREFARYLGVRQTTISNWLRAGYLPSYEKAIILADKLGAEVFEAIKQDKMEEINSENMKKAVYLLSQVDVKTQQKLLEMLEYQVNQAKNKKTESKVDL